MPLPPSDAAGRPRPEYRPITAPRMARTGRGAAVISLVVHLALVLAVFLPPVIAASLDQSLTEGAGGADAAGGGGGGDQGTGGTRVIPERITFFQVAPAPQPAKVPEAPPVPPPTVPEKPLERPPEKPPEKPPPTQPAAPTASEPASPPSPEVGGAPGADPVGGSGPGRGGGVGSGFGSGRGAGTGFGTGGGTAENFPPELSTFVQLPQPVPPKIRPYTLVAWFDVDERGRTTLLAFNPTKDGRYNRRLRETLAEWRFRPAVRPDGTPVRDSVSVEISIPESRDW